MDVLDLVSWVREHNWAIVIGYKEAEYNVFDIDKTDPWRHKWVPDPGRIPARKPSVCRPRFLHKIQPMVSQVKRLLSVPGYSEDEEETPARSSPARNTRIRRFYRRINEQRTSSQALSPRIYDV